MSADPHNDVYTADEAIKRIANALEAAAAEMEDPSDFRPVSPSYPYLSIAKRYGVDYGVVLALGHFATYGELPCRQLIPLPEFEDAHTLQNFIEEIKDAARYFEWVGIHGWEH